MAVTAKKNNPHSILLFPTRPLLRQAILGQVSFGEGFRVQEVSCHQLTETALTDLLVECQPQAAILCVEQLSALNKVCTQRMLLHRLRALVPQLKLLLLVCSLDLSLLAELKTLDIQGCLLFDDELTLHLDKVLFNLCEGAYVYSTPIEKILHRPTPSCKANKLTEKQIAILRAIIVNPNRVYKEHAADLGISKYTFKDHLKKIFARLGVNNLTAAIVLALREGILPLDDLKAAGLTLETDTSLAVDHQHCR